MSSLRFIERDTTQWTGAMRRAQERADAAALAFGNSEGAPRWSEGETNAQYRRRLLMPYQKHSASWRGRDLTKLDAAFLDLAERQIYADALSAAREPTGPLREVKERDAAGRVITKFFGSPNECWDMFKGPTRIVTGWANPPSSRPK